MTKEKILSRLFELQDKDYREFQLKLMPGVQPDAVIGVRTPLLRSLAKTIAKNENMEMYLADVRHEYYDERILYGYVLSEVMDYELCVKCIDAFLPFVDNWATCDLLSPKVFGKKSEKARLIKDVRRWLDSEAPFTRRFGMETLMRHFLDDEFKREYLNWVAEVKSEHYYVRMMQAWFFATALAKQWNATLPILQNRCLEAWTHNKTIQKAIESCRISPEHKTLLRQLRVKAPQEAGRGVFR